jgi:hypothetical protein
LKGQFLSSSNEQAVGTKKRPREKGAPKKLSNDKAAGTKKRPARFDEPTSAMNRPQRTKARLPLQEQFLSSSNEKADDSDGEDGDDGENDYGGDDDDGYAEHSDDGDGVDGGDEDDSDWDCSDDGDGDDGTRSEYDDGHAECSDDGDGDDAGTKKRPREKGAPKKLSNEKAAGTKKRPARFDEPTGAMNRPQRTKARLSLQEQFLSSSNEKADDGDGEDGDDGGSIAMDFASESDDGDFTSESAKTFKDHDRETEKKNTVKEQQRGERSKQSSLRQPRKKLQKTQEDKEKENKEPALRNLDPETDGEFMCYPRRDEAWYKALTLETARAAWAAQSIAFQGPKYLDKCILTGKVWPRSSFCYTTDLDRLKNELRRSFDMEAEIATAMKFERILIIRSIANGTPRCQHPRGKIEKKPERNLFVRTFRVSEAAFQRIWGNSTPNLTFMKKYGLDKSYWGLNRELAALHAIPALPSAGAQEGAARAEKHFGEGAGKNRGGGKCTCICRLHKEISSSFPRVWR